MTESTDLDLRLRRTLRSVKPHADLDTLVSGAMTSVATTRQRPAMRVTAWWTSLGPISAIAVDRRTVILVVAVALVLTMMASALFVASQPRLPAPFGPAQTGSLAYSAGGDLFLHDPATGDTRRLTATDASEWGPVWSRDGRYLAYWRTDAFPDDLRGRCLNSGVTSGACGFETQMLAQAANGFGPERLHDLVVMDPADRSSVTVIEGIRPTGLVDWAPDGDRLVLSAIVEGASRLLLARRDAPGIADVGPAELRPSAPAWSPDGSMIAFRGGTYDSDRGVYVMRSDGTDARRVSSVFTTAGSEALTPTWSPDGARIAFIGGFGSTVGAFVVNVDGTGERYLTTIDYAIASPRWSPDGSRVAVLRGGWTPSATVIVVDADDPDPTSIIYVKGQVDLTPPEWSPDGRWLFGAATPDGTFRFEDRILLLDPTGVSEPVAIDAMDAGGTGSWQRLAP
jgi:dipeptidyl aminopeptidase/acylaminoacyl peptidase